MVSAMVKVKKPLPGQKYQKEISERAAADKSVRAKANPSKGPTITFEKNPTSQSKVGYEWIDPESGQTTKREFSQSEWQSFNRQTAGGAGSGEQFEEDTKNLPAIKEPLEAGKKGVEIREGERIAEIARKEARYNQLVGQEQERLTAPEIEAEKKRTGIPSESGQEMTSELQTSPAGKLQPVTAEAMQEQAEQQVVENPGVLGVVWNLLAGNIIEKNPFTNEINIDPDTGEPYKTQINEFPIMVGELAAASKVVSAAKKGGPLYNLLAKMGGWRSAKAAAARNWTPTFGQIASHQSKVLKGLIFGRTAMGFLGRTSVVGASITLLRLYNARANVNIAMAEADMNDVIGFAAAGMPYGEAYLQFETDIQTILNTRNDIKWLSKIPAGEFMSGTGVTLARIELIEKNLPQLRAKLLRTSEEFIVDQARAKFGVKS